VEPRRTRVRIIASVITLTVAAAIPWAMAMAFSPNTREAASPWAQTPSPTLTPAGDLGSSPAVGLVFAPISPVPLQPLAPVGVSVSDPFLGAYVEGVTQLADGRSMVRIRVPSGVHGEFQAVIAGWGNDTYPCLIPSGHPDRLYCLGNQLVTGVRVSLSLFEIGGGPGRAPVFLAAFYVQSDLPDPVPGGSDVHGQPGASATPTLPTSTSTPLPTPTAGATATHTPTSSPVPPTATSAPTSTFAPPTNTLLPPTDTSVPLPSDTPIPAPTDTPIPVPTDTPVPVPTDTPVPAPTDTPVPAPTDTPVPAPTATA
jgi:hypothetical protein